MQILGNHQDKCGIENTFGLIVAHSDHSTSGWETCGFAHFTHTMIEIATIYGAPAMSPTLFVRSRIQWMDSPRYLHGRWH